MAKKRFAMPTTNERSLAEDMLVDLLELFQNYPEQQTPFMERWFELIVEHGVRVIAAKPPGAAAGRRMQYGSPAKVIECIESAHQFGKPDTWWVKIVS
jgi:hypothetical protein